MAFGFLKALGYALCLEAAYGLSSPANQLGLVAQGAQPGSHFVAMVALDLDITILHSSPAAAILLELARQSLQVFG